MTSSVLRDLERKLGGGLRKRKAGGGSDGADGSCTKRDGAMEEPGAVSSTSAKQSAVLAQGNRSASVSGRKNVKSRSAGKMGQKTEFDMSSLSDEQKQALKKWSVMTPEQRKNLVKKYEDMKQQKLACARNVQPVSTAESKVSKKSAATDYGKWDAWARQIEYEEKKLEASRATATRSVETHNMYGSTGRENLLAEKAILIEAGCCAFLLSLVTGWCLAAINFTLLKQLIFGLLFAVLYAADKNGYLLLFLGGLWGTSLGLVTWLVVPNLSMASRSFTVLAATALGAYVRNPRDEVVEIKS